MGVSKPIQLSTSKTFTFHSSCSVHNHPKPSTISWQASLWLEALQCMMTVWRVGILQNSGLSLSWVELSLSRNHWEITKHWFSKTFRSVWVWRETPVRQERGCEIPRFRGRRDNLSNTMFKMETNTRLMWLGICKDKKTIPLPFRPPDCRSVCGNRKTTIG